MKTPSFILSVLLLLFSQETIAQIVTRYSYDESGNVVSRRDIDNTSHKLQSIFLWLTPQASQIYITITTIVH